MLVHVIPFNSSNEGLHCGDDAAGIISQVVPGPGSRARDTSPVSGAHISEAAAAAAAEGCG